MAKITTPIPDVGLNCNLPGFNRKNLKLNGPVLAEIYAGKIRT